MPAPSTISEPSLKILEGLANRIASCGDAVAEALNDGCFCMSLNKDDLRHALESTLGESGLFSLIEARCPYVFAARPVFVADKHVRQMQRLVQAIESVVALPAYRESVLAAVPEIAQHDPAGAQSAFFGYDFHISGEGIGLIEINTNAGGAMLNAVLAKAQRACCAPVEKMFPMLDAAGAEQGIVDMFRSEWELSNRAKPLQTIAIVDDAPAEQYLYPEFLLFQRLFQHHGIQAIITDPGELRYRDGMLWHGETPIDLVYNRLTDFMLEGPASAALRDAYLERAIVLTPHPQAHALYANKRNLAILTDRARLNEFGVSQEMQDILIAGIPRTEIITPLNAERLWAERRKFFFKPVAGFGSRAAYRGDKLTKRVWEEILAGDYVAQSLIAPSERSTGPDAGSQRLKFDVRAYAYDGIVQWLAARLYQGQTTNFRTPGGGFAPVYRLP